MEKIQGFIRDVISEMKKVSWPNKHDIKEGTIVVVVMSVIVGIFLSITDFVFSKIVNFVF